MAAAAAATATLPPTDKKAATLLPTHKIKSRQQRFLWQIKKSGEVPPTSQQATTALPPAEPKVTPTTQPQKQLLRLMRTGRVRL